MAHRLPINRVVGPDMWDSGTIFRFISAYMDVTDQSFMEEQWMMGAALIASIAIGCGLFFLASFMNNPHAPLFLYVIPAVFIGGFGFLLVRFGRGVMFSLTRMPIRFHRKARKLFAVRGRRYFGGKNKGDHVWEIPWDEEELFCLHKEVTQFGTVYHIRHYALDAEGKVARVFSIGREWTGKPIWPDSIEEISQIDPSDAYAEPRRGTPVGWAETVLAQKRKEYPDAPQRKTEGWAGVEDGVENANQWALGQPPKNLAGG